MRQTGGTAVGETSTRSRPRSRAIFRASNGGRMPSCSPASSITRTSRARILSLMRINCLAERLSMGVLQNSWRCHVATQYTMVHTSLDAITGPRSWDDYAGPSPCRQAKFSTWYSASLPGFPPASFPSSGNTLFRLIHAHERSGILHMKRRILLVDDEVAILLTLQAVLEINGFEVETAASAREAKMKLRASQYHMVITDMRMESDSAGHEVVQAARKSAYNPAVAMLTAFPMPGSEGDEHDADEVLVKPMNTNDLLVQIEALLVMHEDKKRLGQQRNLQAAGVGSKKPAAKKAGAAKAPAAKKASAAVRSVAHKKTSKKVAARAKTLVGKNSGKLARAR